MNSQLTKHLSINNILCEEQYGFRPERSTSTAIFNYLNNIITEINNRKIVGALYLDFSKAFDSINHLRLINKLNDMGIPTKLLSWISSYLENRRIKTKLRIDNSWQGMIRATLLSSVDILSTVPYYTSNYRYYFSLSNEINYVWITSVFMK